MIRLMPSAMLSVDRAIVLLSRQTGMPKHSNKRILPVRLDYFIILKDHTG